ncbi:hypothetical protein CYMTET_31004 [Cymbomonas tetramitiformis]|uniref:C2 NT-type domain-containing protein n=1 Tax=Cymbomonas tetramitiformis TaxID=36881 RepID=A0AAE0FID8_9CHLO|nr:hypothetical protein CYMTET_31004 [Cymbomonas tetramitiformis]
MFKQLKRRALGKHPTKFVFACRVGAQQLPLDSGERPATYAVKLTRRSRKGGKHDYETQFANKTEDGKILWNELLEACFTLYKSSNSSKFEKKKVKILLSAKNGTNEEIIAVGILNINECVRLDGTEQLRTVQLSQSIKADPNNSSPVILQMAISSTLAARGRSGGSSAAGGSDASSMLSSVIGFGNVGDDIPSTRPAPTHKNPAFLPKQPALLPPPWEQAKPRCHPSEGTCSLCRAASHGFHPSNLIPWVCWVSTRYVGTSE